MSSQVVTLLLSILLGSSLAWASWESLPSFRRRQGGGSFWFVVYLAAYLLNTLLLISDSASVMHAIRTSPAAIAAGLLLELACLLIGTAAHLFSTLFTRNLRSSKQLIGLSRPGTIVTDLEPLPEPSSVGLALDPPPAHFKGRLRELADLYRNLSVRTSFIVLSGKPGVGKTALALYFAHLIKDRYPDAQIQVDLQGASDQTPLTSSEVMTRVITALQPGVDFRSQPDIDWTFRSIVSNKQTLILLENATDASQLVPFLEIAPASLFLVTSPVDLGLDGAATVPLEVFSDEEARELFISLCPRVGGEAADIAAETGHLPLALRIAGALMTSHPEISPRDLVSRLQSHDVVGQTLRAAKVAVEEVIDVSYSYLSLEDRARWHFLAVFPAPFDQAAVASVLDLLPDAVDPLLNRFVDLGLLEHFRNRYYLHPLLRRFALARLSPEELDTASFRHSTHYLRVLFAASELVQTGGVDTITGFRMYDGEVTNIQSGHAWATDHLDESAEAARLCSDYCYFGFDVLERRLPARLLTAWAASSLSASNRLGDQAHQAAHKGNLGIAYYYLGEYSKSLQLYSEALAAVGQIGDLRNRELILGNLGLTYKALGEYEKAIVNFEEALAVARTIRDRHGEETHQGNLGSAYTLLGDYRKAIEHFTKAIGIAKEIGDRQDESQHLTNLGSAYDSLDDYQKAIECYSQALAIAKESGDWRTAGNQLYNLSLVHEELGDLRPALSFAEQAVTNYRSIGALEEKDAQEQVQDLRCKLETDPGASPSHTPS